MRFSVAIIALIGAVVATPTPATNLDPAPAPGAECTCGQAPEIVYSRCFENADGSHSIWNCFPGGGACHWSFVANAQC